MTSKAFELAKLGNAYSDGALSNRNLIINGAMQVAQRGTSVSTGNGYTLDRWYTNSQSSLLATASQEDDSTFNFGEKHLKFVSASGASYSYVSQKIENMKQFSGKTLTLSFDYTSTHSFSSSLEYHYGTGGSAAEYDLQGVTVPAAASATRYSRTFTIPDLSAKTFGPDNTSHLHILFNCTTNPATLKITNVQLEVGDTATPFEHEPYSSVTLQKCQRYYQTDGGNVDENEGVGVAYSTTKIRGQFQSFNTTMRVTPSLAFDNVEYYVGSWQLAGNAGLGGITTTGFAIDITGSALTNRAGYPIEYTWTADAEI